MTRNFVIAGNAHQYLTFLRTKMVRPEDYKYVGREEVLKGLDGKGTTIYFVGDYSSNKIAYCPTVHELKSRGALFAYSTL